MRAPTRRSSPGRSPRRGPIRFAIDGTYRAGEHGRRRYDSQHLVSCSADQTVKLWKIEGNAAKEVQTFRGHKDWVTGIAFSKDGFHVASSSVDRKVKIWEITNRELPLLAEHTAPVLAVAVSPDGSTIATGSEDHSIKLWDAKTGIEKATLDGHPSRVLAWSSSRSTVKRLYLQRRRRRECFWEVVAAA